MYEVTEGLLIAVLGTNLVALLFVAWQLLHFSRRLRHCIRQARRLVIPIFGTAGKMDCDELIDELLSAQGAGTGTAEGAPLAAAPAGGTTATPDAPQGQEEERVQKHRERLAALVAGGQAGQYGLVVRGKAFTADQIDALDNTEIEKLYARYEARLGAVMTKTLGSAALQLYAGLASMFLPIPAESQPGLIADLEGDPFVGHALSSATCELYHRYGMYLAPLTAALTTMKHCRFGHQCPIVIYDTNDVGERADSWGATATGEPRDHSTWNNTSGGASTESGRQSYDPQAES
ncbi:MAG: hypothetical protein AB2692_17325 [Candidatus Thiodiazotropha sp.]